MASGKKSRGLVLLLITSCFFITGLLFDYMPAIVDDHIKRTLELATNDEIISFWSRPPIDLHSYYWLYDITNAEQFTRQGEKLQVRKVGPFHFISRIEKRIIDLSANKFRLTYNSTRFMRLNESYSSQLLDTQLHLLNPILVSVLAGVRINGEELDAQTRAIATGSVNKLLERYNETLVYNQTARSALMGRDAPIVDKLRKMAAAFGMADRLPEMASSSKFGYAALQNNTLSGPYEIYTGYQETARSLGDLISYKGKRRLDYYEGKCNRLQVSAGELRPMPIDPQRTLEMFSPQFCRIAHLTPTSQFKMREGQAVSYAFSPDDFSSAQLNADNQCYCTNTSSYENHCSLNGVIELAPCSYNAPLLLAMSNIPVDPKIAATIADFEPEMLRGEVEELADGDERAQIVILKRVGVPIKADLTITLLMKVIRDTTFRQTVNLPEVSYVPLLSVRETIKIPAKFAQILINLESFLSLTYHIKVVMYLSAIVLLCWLTGHYYCLTSTTSPVGHTSASIMSRNSSSSPPPPPPPPPPQSGGASNSDGGEDPPPPPPPAGRRFSALTLGAGPDGRVGVAPGTDFQAGQVQSQAPPPPPPPPPPTVGLSRTRRGVTTGVASSGGSQLRTVEERIVEASQTNDTPSANERANSTDSSRSLPPSRHTSSRLGSIETAPAGDSAAEVGAPEAAISTQPGSVTRIFSKVDSELRARGNTNNNQAAGDQPEVASGDPTADSSNNTEQSPDTESTSGSGKPHRKRRPQGWFMSVYSNFVRMLNGLRASINDAGQLEVEPRVDDLQDRQLEMLAGKIDNWYGGGSGSRAHAGSSGQAGAAAAAAASEPAQSETKAEQLETKSSEQQSERNKLEQSTSESESVAPSSATTVINKPGAGPASSVGVAEVNVKGAQKSGAGMQQLTRQRRASDQIAKNQSGELDGASLALSGTDTPTELEALEDSGADDAELESTAEDKASTLRRIEAALGDAGSAPVARLARVEEAVEPSAVLASASASSLSSSSRPRMINSSTSTDDSMVAAAGAAEVASRSSSHDSRVTQVMASNQSARRRSSGANGSAVAVDESSGQQSSRWARVADSDERDEQHEEQAINSTDALSKRADSSSSNLTTQQQDNGDDNDNDRDNDNTQTNGDDKLDDSRNGISRQLADDNGDEDDDDEGLLCAPSITATSVNSGSNADANDDNQKGDKKTNLDDVAPLPINGTNSLMSNGHDNNNNNNNNHDKPTTPMTFQQQQGFNSANGNNILNEKIISQQSGDFIGNQEQQQQQQQRVSESQATANHHHQRVQPAGA